MAHPQSSRRTPHGGDRVAWAEVLWEAEERARALPELQGRDDLAARPGQRLSEAHYITL